MANQNKPLQVEISPNTLTYKNVKTEDLTEKYKKETMAAVGYSKWVGSLAKPWLIAIIVGIILVITVLLFYLKSIGL